MLTRPAWVLLMAGAFTVFFLWRLPTLLFDSSPATLILPDSAETAYYAEVTRLFGNDQIVLVGIGSGNLLSTLELRRIRELTTALEGIDGVKRVLSLTNVLDVQGTEDEVRVSPLVPENLDALDRDALSSRLRANPFLQRNLIAPDFHATAVLVFLDDFEGRSTLRKGREVTLQVRSTARNLFPPDQVFISGLPEMELQGTENMVRDLYVFTPLTLFVVVGILGATFRCKRGVLLPLGMISLALVWTMGAMSWSRCPLKVTTLSLPSLLISNASTYVIHLLAQYYQALGRAYARHGDQCRLDSAQYRSVLLETLRHAHPPLLIAAATTMAGFGSLAFTQIPAIRDLGLFATLGILFSYLLSITLVPVILFILPVPQLSKVRGQKGSRRHAALERLGNFGLRCRYWIYGAAAASIVWGILGLLRVEVRSDYLAYFRKSAPVVKAAERFHNTLAGVAPLSIVVQATGDRRVTDLDILGATETLQLSLKEIPGIDASFSFVDTLKVLNRAFHGEDPRQFRLPDDPAVLSDLLDFSDSEPGGMNAAFLSADRRHLRILARSHLFGSRELRQATQQIQATALRLFSRGFAVHVVSSLTLLNTTSDRVAIEQSRSLALSGISIAVMVLLLFRSWKVGMLAMMHAGLPVLLFFGLMGWNGVALNVNTCMIASIALGITVDNCLHYLVHFQRACSFGLRVPEAALQGLTEAGGPMIASAVALALGFLVFAFSRFVPVAHFGWLSAFIMGINLLADLFLLPSLMLLLSAGTVRALRTIEE